jgi:uncharacterized protein with NAD-binding domain and iron-sulfur cluster
MTQKQLVYVLGGGMAALAAAHELSRTQELRDTYQVIVLQRGWRLGGKCASSRAPHPADPASLRVQEHGLHVWFGFYMNSFSMMRDCYGQLNRSGLSIRDLFERRNSTPLMEHHDGRWLDWPLDFPEDPPGHEPGQVDSIPTLADIADKIVKLVARQLDLLQRKLAGAGLPVFGDTLQWLAQMLASPAWSGFAEVVGDVRGQVEALVEAFLPGEPKDEEESPPLVPPQTLALLQQLWSDDAKSSEWARLRTLIDAVGPQAPDLFDELRRLWIMADLASATARGLAASSTTILKDGLGALDGQDLRRWLSDHQASRESVSSAPIRALYDLCFAYADGDSTGFGSANFAAGVALRCVFRIAFGYRGAVCYTMKLGMGEAVIAPLYEVLRRNGVQFEFFHQVTRLVLRDGQVQAIRFRRQARVKASARYVPTKPLTGALDYWPARPFFDQLVDGDKLEKMLDIDFESDLSPSWGGGSDEEIDLTKMPGDLPKVIFAISAGGFLHNKMTEEVADNSTQWKGMLASLATVATQSAQLWFARDLTTMGYRHPDKPPAMIAAPEPMDVWADMRSVLASERWGGARRPVGVQYICGPLAGTFSTVPQAYAAVRTTTLTWLNEMARSAWPGCAKAGTFDERALFASGAPGVHPLQEQWIRANFEGSERYVLSKAGSIESRLRADALPAENLYVAGDWTANGINAGCVEAAVMAGIQAARSIRGLDLAAIPGFGDKA